MERKDNTRFAVETQEIPLIGPVRCEWPSGRVLDLWATGLSPGGVRCLCLDPPPVGTRVTLGLTLLNRPEIPPVESWVIAARLDPECAECCGFEAVFVQPGEEVLRAIVECLPHLKPVRRLKVSRRTVPVPQRRTHPRIGPGLQGLLCSFSGLSRAKVRNISMKGALLAFQPEPRQPRIAPGDTLEITLPSPDPGQKGPKVRVRAVRSEEEAGTLLVGTEFIGLDEATRTAIERLLLRLVVTGESVAAGS